MNKEKKHTLIKELLSGSLNRAKRQEIAAMDAVDNELNKQWDESGKQMVDVQTKESIWKNIHKKLEKKNNYQVHLVLKQYGFGF